MQRPEHLLPHLNIALRELLSASQVLSLKEDALDEMYAVVRRLQLAEVMEGKSIIAVGGSQGAGKTTLVCSMYELPQGELGWFAPNTGRGETLPVLIEEVTGLDKPEGWVKVLRKRDGKDYYELAEDRRDPGPFRNACQGKEKGVMLPILKVPRRYLVDPGQALLLLPGYETKNRLNRVWQELMRQALIGATSWVIVTDSTRMAGDDQRLIAGDMQAGELRGARPIVVVSKTEIHENDLGKLDQLRQRAAEIFGLVGEDAWRHVVCSGTDGPQHPAYSAIWVPHLEKELRDASFAGDDARQGQLALLRDTLQLDLPRVLETIRTQSTLKFQVGDAVEAVDAVRDLLDAFDDASAELREKHAAAIRRLLGTHAVQAQKDLDPVLEKDFEGLRNFLKSTGESRRAAHRRLQDAVEKAWRDAGKTLDPEQGKPLGEPLDRYFQALGDMTTRPLKLAPVADGSSPLQRLGYANSEGLPVASVLVADETRQNMLALFGDHTAQPGSPRTTRELEKTVKLLPTMAVEYVRIATIIPAVASLDLREVKELGKGTLSDDLKSAQAQFGKSGEIFGNVLKGLGALLAIDVAVDGEVDLPDAIRKLLGLASGGAGAVAVGNPWVAGAAAAIATLFLAHEGLKQIRHQEAQVAQLGFSMVRSIEDHWTAHLLAHYDEIMRTMRRALEERLRLRYQLDTKLMHRDHLAKAMADVQVQCNHILTGIASSGEGFLPFERAAA